MTKTDDKGRVMRQSELITSELEDILVIGFKDEDELIKSLAAYILQREHDTFFRAYRDGLVQGRKEIVAVMETVIGEDEPVYNPVPWSAGVHEKEVDNEVRRSLRKEQRHRLSQAVEAVTKGKADV